MRFYVEKDYDALSQRAANIIAAQVISKPDCVLGLATGSSPVGTYKNLVAKYENGDLDFSQVKTANLDEYKGLPKDNDQSYYYFMHDHLFDHVNIDPANTNIPDGTCEDSEAECAHSESDTMVISDSTNRAVNSRKQHIVLTFSQVRLKQINVSLLPLMMFRNRLTAWASEPLCAQRKFSLL